MKNLHSINLEQNIFVFNEGKGFSCLGFDVVFKRLKQYAEILGLKDPDPAEKGTKQQLSQYFEAESALISSGFDKTLFDPETPAEVQAVLESCRIKKNEIRIFYGDPDTGKDWYQEYDTKGRVGRSMGPLKIALLVPKGKFSGGAILTSCIVKIVDLKTNKILYKHENYHQGSFELKNTGPESHPWEVFIENKLQARFKTEKKAQTWMNFIKGF